jgi:hypothetical protein
MHRDSGNIYAEFGPIFGKSRRWPAPQIPGGRL